MGAASERDDLAGAHAFVGGEHDAEAVHRVVHVGRQIDVLADRAQEERLLAIAEPLVIGLVLGVDVLVRPRELAVGVERRVMQPDRSSSSCDCRCRPTRPRSPRSDP